MQFIASNTNADTYAIICKYMQYMQRNMQYICKIYAEIHAEIYAKIYTKIHAKIYAELPILHIYAIYALPRLLMPYSDSVPATGSVRI